MSGFDNKLHITKEMLEDFASMNQTWFDFWSNKTFDGKMEVVVNDFYKMTLDDLYSVLQRININNFSTLEFCVKWYQPLIEKVYTNLCLDDLFGPNPRSIEGYRMICMPESDEDLMMWIFKQFCIICKDVSFDKMDVPVKDVINVDDILQQIEWHTDDEGLPPEERRYIDDIKRDFLMQYDNDLILQEAPNDIRTLFRMYCDELADKKDLDALRIKGYACYGGNSIYECDWEAAAKCMEILWREGSFGYAANTLGYIYYYGRLNNNIPDYEKAFYYYSIGNTFGIIESGYKLADMFMNGFFVKKNLDMASSIIEKFYGESRYRFEQGEFDGKFADIALRMGKLQLLKPSDEFFNSDFHAYRLFLQAEFALTMRMLECRQYGDQKVMASIKNLLDKTYDSVEHKKSVIHVPFPYPIYELVGSHSYCIYNLNLKELKSGLKITVTRNSNLVNRDYDLTLITYPEFSRCDLTDTVSLIAENIVSSSTYPSSNETLFDDVQIEDSGLYKTHSFFFRGERVFSICAERYQIKLPKK